MYIGEKYPDNLINSSYLLAVASMGEHTELNKLLSTNYKLDDCNFNPLCFLLLVKNQSSEHIKKTIEMLVDYSNKQQNGFITKNILIPGTNLSVNIAERLVLEGKEEYLSLIQPYVYLRSDFLQDLTRIYITSGKKQYLHTIDKIINHYDYSITNNALVQHVLLIKGLNYNSDMIKNTYENRLIEVLDIYTQKNDNHFCAPVSKRSGSGLNFMSMIATHCSSIKLLEYCINLIDFDVNSVKHEITNTFRKSGKNAVNSDVYNYIHGLSQAGVDSVREHFLLNKELVSIDKNEKKFKL